MFNFRIPVTIALVWIAFWSYGTGLFAQSSAKIRVAVAGIAHGHSSWIFGKKISSDIEVVAIYETDVELIDVYSKRFNLKKDLFYNDLAKMLDQMKPEAVLAFNPTSEHLSVVQACAPRGIHVMVEKPLATTVKDAEAMEMLAKKHKIHLLTNYETSWYPTTEKTWQLVNDSSFVGGLRKVIFHTGHEGARNIEANKFFFKWLTDPVKNGGGALPDFGCYGANLMTYLTNGEHPLSVMAVTRQFKPEIYPKVEDEATIVVSYPSAQCLIQASWNWPFNRKDMQVYGESGYIITENDSIMTVRNKQTVSERTRKLTLQETKVYNNPFSYFAAVIRGKIPIPAYGPYSLENNMMVVRILEAAEQSAKSGKMVHLKKNKVKPKRLSAINHIVHMGQSLGAGEQSLPIVTDAPTGFNNLRFSLGTHTWANNYHPARPELRKVSDFQFVPLTAVQRGGEGETIANGLCDHLSQTIGGQGSKNFQFLFSYAGQGGRYLRELNKRHDDAKDDRAETRRSEGGYYKTSIDDVRRAKKTADSMKLSYAVFGITWMQGEANGTRKLNRWDSIHTPGESMAIYKSDLIQLKNDYQKDIKAITLQKQHIPFFTYQTAGNLAGMAQWQACQQEKDMFMVGATYMLPNAENGHYMSRGQMVHGDGIHLTADAERWLGEQFGKVMRKVVVEGKDWKPLYPLTASYKENEQAVIVKFHVPEPPLVMDTDFLPAQDKGLGFEVYDDKNRRYTIEKVECMEDAVVKIALEDALPVGSTLFLRYGMLSKAADISRPVKVVRQNVAGKDGHPSIDIVFEGNILQEVSILSNEGVFYLNNQVKDQADFTNLIIRETFLDKNGNTVLRGEVKDLRNQVSFQAGQQCYTARRFSYGNLRDSDSEKSTFQFKDTGYGRRQGMSYPLYNWCIAFQDLKVGR